ncbi:hypothetical protein F1188_14935 [Roseospira marina]|uniref:Phage tail fibre protein N-terminal domain-containing protein n=1 Tax=Roseospira marina TaxID=140057 RepID=A0A5M6IAF3_9PROT|nr:phage tail protein [Roseospira marina]KAA5604705.1 hypothetical protein F1188_14935 [Roseospira marina]MBB4315153.1 hypothetical protein [Roseospira marina]MBB5088077.1 hypothetical protein [Roseospira marina]
MAAYYGLLTTIGAAKIANGLVTGQAVELTHMAVGDGGGAPVTPEQTATALVHEVYRSTPAGISRTPADEAVLEALLVIPPQTGGWTIREVGAFDADGDLILLANWPETYKPVIAEGASNDMALKIQAVVGSTANITLKIDASLQYATQACPRRPCPLVHCARKSGQAFPKSCRNATAKRRGVHASGRWSYPARAASLCRMHGTARTAPRQAATSALWAGRLCQETMRPVSGSWRSLAQPCSGETCGTHAMPIHLGVKGRTPNSRAVLGGCHARQAGVAAWIRPKIPFQHYTVTTVEALLADVVADVRTVRGDL